MKYALLMILLTASTVRIADAQEISCPANAQAADSARAPDFLIRASASAESIRFETQPQVEVRLTGCAVLDTVRIIERRNLPDPVQPGVTYRDVYIAAEILGYLNVDCLLEGVGGSVGIQPAPAGAQPADVAAAEIAARAGSAAGVPYCGTETDGSAPEAPSGTPSRSPAGAPSPAGPPAPEAPPAQANPAEGPAAGGSPQGLFPHPLILRPHLASADRRPTSATRGKIGRLHS